MNFPVDYRGWRTAAIRFTPARSGTVTLTLMGPWEEAEKGVVYRQEVLWDDVRVEGATLANGGFEATRGRRAAAAWQGPGIIAIADAPTCRPSRGPNTPGPGTTSRSPPRSRSPAAGR